MTNIHISDYDCVTCFGDGYEILWESLLAGKCGFKPVNRFETKNFINSIAGCIAELDLAPHGERFPALLEILFRKDLSLDRNAVILTATTKDNIELYEKHIRTPEKDPHNFPTCSIVDFLSKRFGAKGPSHNVNTACASAGTAILWAAEMIRNGETDEVVVCGADIVSEFIFSGFSALMAMSSDTSRPFDVNRNGLVLGEAAGYVVLVSEKRLLQKNKTSLGIVKGGGTSSDAHHITAPSRQGSGLQRAIHNAVEKASIQTDEIVAINAHGTGTVHNDAMEMTAFGHVFSDLIPPVFSIKGSIGHTLGPCGLIEIIVASRSLQEQVIPPVTGLQELDSQFDACVPTSPQRFDGEYMLSTNSGFGGINTALILERP